ncbi:5'-nucleotidase [Allocatelliglobosispora scoriae]|uniref:5'-nucleotidase n=1 Tax=Allocatelliglobosispora scoriae TaxID=643052 RepID=A0A841BKY5_9ACTN|nr:5'/3'-nucleotidase SurE [Allocatelliglobosispora scoriae]MBB5867653.1 5'-nucleotidase [Allocatelliglobosispora scoriae]
MTRVLITNDDGIDSPGLHALARMAAAQGFDVVVAAPASDTSGASASLTAVQESGRIVTTRRELPDLPDIAGYAVSASPALIALIATRGAFGPPPDLVLSGINRGGNIGHAVLHSGTVGAALTASAQGCPALAVSLASEWAADGTESHWESAATVAAGLLAEALAAPPGVVLNVNVPDLPFDKVGGVRRATLAAFGMVQTSVEAGDGFVRMTIAEAKETPVPGTDAAALADGYACVTPLRAITEA